MGKTNSKDEFPGAVTIADLEGKILYLNQKAAQVLEKEGGFKLIGQNIFNCHKPESKDKIRKIIEEKNQISSIILGRSRIYRKPYLSD